MSDVLFARRAPSERLSFDAFRVLSEPSARAELGAPGA